MDRWISPEERLPERFEPVIICRDKEKGRMQVEQGCLEVGGWWKVYGTRVRRIAFWMPMPQPPQIPAGTNDR